MKKVRDLKWGIEYDFDETTQTMSKVLQCYHSDGTITNDRLEYEYDPMHFSTPYDSELNKVTDSL